MRFWMPLTFNRWRDDDRYRDRRQQMIHETETFLSWALAKERGLPRIPRRRVDKGGFGAFISRPGARALMEKWWDRAVDSGVFDRFVGD